MPEDAKKTETTVYAIQIEREPGPAWVESSLTDTKENAVAAVAALSKEEEAKAAARTAAGMPVETTGRYRVNERKFIEETVLAYDTRGLDGEPTVPEVPDQKPPEAPGEPDQGLPPVVDNSLPGDQPEVDNSLPGDQPEVDNSLPGDQPEINNDLPTPPDEQPPAENKPVEPVEPEPKKRR